MRKLIGRIRRQSKQTRDNIAFGIASGFTCVVVTMWLFTVPSMFSNVLTSADSAQSTQEGFFDKISSQAAAVKESIGSTESATDSLEELMAEYQSSSTQSTSEVALPNSASSTATTAPAMAKPRESFDSFTTDSKYESDQPREVRILAVPKSTTSTTIAE